MPDKTAPPVPEGAQIKTPAGGAPGAEAVTGGAEAPPLRRRWPVTL
jgi:hypothetical protein